MNQKVKTILITGTHITPAVELINQLKNDPLVKWNIVYIGRKHNSSTSDIPSIESKLIPSLGVKFFGINCGKLDRRWFPNTIKGIPQTCRALTASLEILKKTQPDIVISFGGYVSVPVIIASEISHIPSITHEQTLTNSLSTRINSYFTDKIALSFNNKKQIGSLPGNKVVVTGNLLRSQIYTTKSKLFSKIKTKLPIIYVTAGNQGSQTINQTISHLLPQLKNFLIIHPVGQQDYSQIKKLSSKYPNYLVYEYIGTDDIGWVLNKAQIIISRSGANTSQEIVALNKKSILIPLPFSQQDEQLKNAQWVQDKLPHHTIILDQSQLNPESLLTAINNLLEKPELKKDKINHGNQKLVQVIHDLI